MVLGAILAEFFCKIQKVARLAPAQGILKKLRYSSHAWEQVTYSASGGSLVGVNGRSDDVTAFVVELAIFVPMVVELKEKVKIQLPILPDS